MKLKEFVLDRKTFLNSFYLRHKDKKSFWFFCYLPAAFLLIAPLWGDFLYWLVCGDLVIHTRLVKSMQAALFHEQAFPPLYSNDAGLMLQPIFRYYSVVIYLVSSLFMGAGLSAYNSLLLGAALFCALGAWGVFLIARFFRCGETASWIGGLSYLYAPYMTVNLYARAAYPEISALGVLPLLFYAQIRLAASNGRRWGAAAALLTALSILAHKIFFPWAALLGTLFVLLMSLRTSVKKIILRRLFPLFFWTGAGMILSSTYWLASVLNLKEIGMTKTLSFSYAALTHWSLLLSPYFHVAHESSTPALATQYGAPVMAGILLLMFKKNDLLKYALLTGFAALFAVQADIGHAQRVIPAVLCSIQFPYRLLLFSALWGSLSLAAALSAFGKKFRKLNYFALGLIGLFLALYYRIPSTTQQPSCDAEKAPYVQILFHEKPYEKISEQLKTSGVAGDGWLNEETALRIERKPRDDAKLFLSGLIPPQIRDEKDFEVTVFLDQVLWRQKKYAAEEREISFEGDLPGVSALRIQEIKLRFSGCFIPHDLDPSSSDLRRLSLSNSVLKATNNYQTVVSSSEWSAKGSQVRLRIPVQKGHQYILPVMYSKYLETNQDFMTVAPHQDGIVLESARDGLFDIIVKRNEYDFLTVLGAGACLVMMIALFFIKCKKRQGWRSGTASGG